MIEKGTKYSKSGLTPAKKKFAQIYAKTDNATLAVRKSFDNHYTELSVRNKASNLLTNSNIQTEIQLQKLKLESLSKKAINKVGQLIDSTDDKIATSNSQFVINKVHPTITKNESTNLNISIEAMLNNLDQLQ